MKTEECEQSLRAAQKYISEQIMAEEIRAAKQCEFDANMFLFRAQFQVYLMMQRNLILSGMFGGKNGV